MRPFWIETGLPLRMALVPRPRPGTQLEPDLRSLKAAGLDILVSMLPPAEAASLGLAAEAEAATQAGLDFHSFPLSDGGIPSTPVPYLAFVELLRQKLHAGQSLGVHCYASIGRSSLLLATILVLEGLTPDDAFRRLTHARGTRVPDTQAQVDWVTHLAAALQ
jgi:protein-tyrosine phosphatase